MIRKLVQRALPQDGKSDAARQARSVTVNLAELPLSWLHARKLVSDRQLAAGELLRTDYERAGLAGRTTMIWDAPPSDGNARGPQRAGHEQNGRIDAKARFHAAVHHAGGGLSDVLWRVVCAGERLPEAEKALGWPSRSGRLVLTLALDRVADYYRVPG